LVWVDKGDESGIRNPRKWNQDIPGDSWKIDITRASPKLLQLFYSRHLRMYPPTRPHIGITSGYQLRGRKHWSRQMAPTLY
jgi:hypothetical protein